MADISNQFAKLSDGNSWKNRCIHKLKDSAKKFSAPGPGSEILDLLKKKKEEELKLQTIKNKIQEVEKRFKELENDESTTMDISSSKLKLYQLTTKLTFDLESPPNELRGFVNGRPLKVFQLDTTVHSKQYIVDYLWKLIDPDST